MVSPSASGAANPKMKNESEVSERAGPIAVGGHWRTRKVCATAISLRHLAFIGLVVLC